MDGWTDSVNKEYKKGEEGRKGMEIYENERRRKRILFFNIHGS
jgi:hypothetical protein